MLSPISCFNIQFASSKEKRILFRFYIRPGTTKVRRFQSTMGRIADTCRKPTTASIRSRGGGEQNSTAGCKYSKINNSFFIRTLRFNACQLQKQYRRCSANYLFCHWYEAKIKYNARRLNNYEKRLLRGIFMPCLLRQSTRNPNIYAEHKCTRKPWDWQNRSKLWESFLQNTWLSVRKP